MKTGLPLLDINTGGGLPAGVTEVFGPTGTGKTCLGLAALREYEGPKFLLLSHFPDPSFVLEAGCDCPVVLPQNMDDALHIMTSACNAFPGILIVADSLSDLERLHEIGRLSVDNRKRTPFSDMHQLARVAASTGSRIILINDARQNIGGRGIKSSMESSCSRMAAIRIKVAQAKYTTAFGTLKQVTCTATLVKAPEAQMGSECKYDWWPGTGINRGVELLRALVFLHHAVRSGPWWILADRKLGPGLKLAAEAATTHYEELACLLKRLS